MRILLVAYYFPPLNRSGSLRPWKLAKFLSQFGHEVFVLTATYCKNEMGENKTIRIFDPSHNNDRYGKYFFAWLFFRLFTETLNRLGIYHSIFSWWLRRVRAEAGKIIEYCRPQLIIATYPPVETLQIGLELSRLYHLPLFADFRDGLLFESIEAKRILRYSCLMKKYAQIEKEVAQTAKKIVVVSPPIGAYFRERYNVSEVHTVMNGYDLEDFQNIEKNGLLDADYFHIVHTGRLGLSDAGCSLTGIVRALDWVAERDAGFFAKVRIHFVGDLARDEQRELSKWLRAGVAIYHGCLPRERALAFQIRANLLLLITSMNRESLVTSKLFEYLAAGKPILALTGKTYARQIIEETGSGWCVPADDSMQIGNIMLRIISEPDFLKTLLRNEKKIAFYSSQEQVGRFAALLVDPQTWKQDG